ncbi:MAG: M28 family peptidase, partial [Planctomycetes bacterium]|nr:M28 family peptidase [Planctomycetota bacterium]
QFRNIWVRPLPSQLTHWPKPPFPIFNGSGGGEEATHFLGDSTERRLRDHVKMLCSIDPPREGGSISGMQIASAYIATQLMEMGCTVTSQEFPVQDRIYRNLTVRLGPSEGPLTVVGAHYDVCDSTPGADDNASGVAVLLELARELRIAHPRSPIELVFYALEEPPYFHTEHMGSAHHAKALKAAGTNVRGMIALEMLGYYSEEEGSQKYPIPAMAELYPSAGNFLALVGRPEDQTWIAQVQKAMTADETLPVETLAAPRTVEGVDFSDHASYWDAGFPAVMLTDTAHLRNPNYHELTDTPETLNYENMERIVGGLETLLRGLK